MRVLIFKVEPLHNALDQISDPGTLFALRFLLLLVDYLRRKELLVANGRFFDGPLGSDDLLDLLGRFHLLQVAEVLQLVEVDGAHSLHLGSKLHENIGYFFNDKETHVRVGVGEIGQDYGIHLLKAIFAPSSEQEEEFQAEDFRRLVFALRENQGDDAHQSFGVHLRN